MSLLLSSIRVKVKIKVNVNFPATGLLGVPAG
jgi:hypothetical protein